MSNKKCDLLIIPAANLDPVSGKLDTQARKRLDRAAELLNDGRAQAVCILGGKAEVGASLALEHQQYFVKHYPKLAHKIAFIDAQAKCTNRDIAAAIRKIDRYFAVKIRSDRARCSVGVVTYTLHAERAKLVLRYFGYWKVHFFHSGEFDDYPLWQEKLLITITRMDPCWRMIGLPLVWLTSTRNFRH